MGLRAIRYSVCIPQVLELEDNTHVGIRAITRVLNLCGDAKAIGEEVTDTSKAAIADAYMRFV